MDPDEDPVAPPPRRPRGPQPPRRTRGGDGAGASSHRRGSASSADERNRAALPNSSRRAASSARRRRESSAMSGSGRSVSGSSAAASARGESRASSSGGGHHHRPSRHSEGKQSAGGGTGRRRDSSSRGGGSDRSGRVDRSDRSARSHRTGGGHRHHSSSSAKPSSRPGGSRRDGRGGKEERKPSRGRPDSDESSEEFIDFTSDIDEDDAGSDGGPDDLTETTPSAAHFDDESGAMGFGDRIGDQDGRGAGRLRSVDGGGGERFEPIGEDDGDSGDSLSGDGDAMDPTNSPEPNPRRSADADAEAFPLLTAAPHREVDSASIADMTFTEVLSRFDPPTSDDGRPSTPADLEPDLDARSHFSRLNAPPSPSGPEPNRRRGGTIGDDGGAAADARPAARGQDPPEGRRGGDPSQAGSADPPPYRGGSPTTRRPGRSRDGPPPPDGPRRPEIKGILKKRGAPIPINQFGRPVLQFQDDDDGEGGGGDGASGSDEGGGMDESDPDMTEEKSSRSAPDDERSAYSSATQTTLGTARSGLRSGKWAAANERALAAQAGHVDDDEEEEDGTEYDYEDPEYDALSAASDEHTLKSAADARFDRSRSHFLRTADLGLTQDTIFAEQFLEDERTKPEPHYHHPSPHPPPGVQFNIDENWVSVDDGRGDHSPIAPQAVDALVAMGYRAASDPMMWTPTSKTRKYMTEKELRFDDIPIPGSVDEGVGGPDDGDCLVWSGKFPHKYHGHDQPVVRSQAIVNMTAEELVDLLMDSGRVGEYNKSSIGRDDELVLSDGTDLDSCPFSGQRKKKLTGVVMAGATIVDGNAVMDSESDCESVDVEEIVEEIEYDNGDRSVRTVQTSASSRRRRSSFVGVTKLVRTQNKPPLIRRVLEFYTLLHCRALTDEQGDGYIIVGRGITPASEDERGGKGVMRSEILINVHIIRKLHKHRRGGGGGGSSSGGSSSRDRKRGSRYRTVSDSGRRAGKGDLSNRCLLITVNHIKSAMIPKMIAKRVGLSAAVNFVLDIRALSTYPG